MREIKFRGKRIDNGKWVYGNLIIENACDLKDGIHPPNPQRIFISEQDKSWVSKPNDKSWRHQSFEVDPETVGQFTGLKDKNGKEIYEGDIVNAYPRNPDKQYWRTIIWNKELAQFQAPFSDGSGIQLFTRKQCLEYEIIGNIHKNLELLGKSK